MHCFFFFSSRRRHTRFDCDWSSDVCSSDLVQRGGGLIVTDVSPDGPAYQRLLAADDGGPDIIVAVNGAPTRTRAALREALRKVKPGEVVTLQVLRRTPDTADGWAGTVVRLRAR